MSMIPLVDHGFSSDIDAPLQHWVDFLVDKHINMSYLKSSTFRYTVMSNGDIIDKQVVPLCEQIDCNHRGPLRTFIDAMDINNITYEQSIHHIIEFYDEHGTQLLCSEAEFQVEAIRYTLYSISDP